MDFSELIARARAVLSPRALSADASAGGVAAAILTRGGHVYTGVCIDTACSMGFCAEHAAAAAMVTAGEHEIAQIVAVGSHGQIMPPCGRCREFLYQINHENLRCEILLKNRVATLDELLPERWED